MLLKVWLNKSLREFEHIEIIDIKEVNELEQSWGSFSKVHHLQYKRSIEESWLWLYPHRSCEALYSMMSGIVNDIFPIRKTNNLADL